MDEPSPPLPPSDATITIPADPVAFSVKPREELLHLHRTTKAQRRVLRTKRTKRREEQQARDAWVMDMLHGSGMGEGSEYVGYSFERERRRVAGRAAGTTMGEEDSSEDSGAEEAPCRTAARTDRNPQNTIDLTDPIIIDETTLLVFSPDTLPARLSHLITTYPPQAYPLARRTVPANSVYLMARYAAYRSVDAGTARARLTALLEMVMLEVERVCLVRRSFLAPPPIEVGFAADRVCHRRMWRACRILRSGCITRQSCCISCRAMTRSGGCVRRRNWG